MKKSTKIWFIVAASMIGLGLFLALIGKGLGGDKQVTQWVLNGDLSFGPLHFNGMDINLTDMAWNDAEVTYKGNVEKTAVDNTQNVSKLYASVGGTKVEFRVSQDDSFYFESAGAPKFQCYASNDALYLTAGTEKWNADGAVIYVYLPKDQDFKNVEIELGAGEIIIEALKAESTAIEIGAGSMTVSSLTAKELCVEIGAGSAKMSDVNTVHANTEVGMGEIILEGSISGNLEAECAMGSMQFTVDGKENDHNYEIDCAMGSVRVGSDSYEGFASERTA